MKKQINNLQILRILAALAVFMFHCYHDMKCDFGFLNPLLEYAWFYMTFFFVLSGFVIYYSYSDKDMTDFENIKSFIKKRIIRLFPLYFLVNTVSYFTTPTKSFLDIATFPLQFSMLFSGTFFNYLVNRRTWFISSIFICYLLSPYFISIIKKINSKTSIIFLIFLISISSCYPIIAGGWSFVNTYHTAFVRIFHFLSGMLLSKLIFENKIVVKNKYLDIAMIFTIALTILCICDLGANVDTCSIILCCLLLVTFVLNNSQTLQKINECKIINVISKYSFEIYCGTAYTTMLMPFIFNYLDTPSTNIILCFIVNIIIMFFLVGYQRITKKIINKISLKKYLVYSACLEMIAIMFKNLL